jgi:hypothetical protein
MIRRLLFLSVLLTQCALVGAAYPPLSEEQEKSYYTQLEKEIDASETRLLDAFKNINNPDSIDSSARAKVQALSAALEVKHTLFNNFYQTDSLKSPAVRDALLKLFEKQTITPEDILQFKVLVDAEKEKIRLENLNPQLK